MAGFDMEEILEAYRRKWEGHRAQATEYSPPVYKCPHCKDTGFLDLYPPNPRKPAEGKISTMIYCPYCRTNMLKDISGIIAEYRELDINKFPWETYKKDISKLKQIVESFVYDFQKWQDEGIGLYIYSDVKGSGKTMVANAICGSICAKYNMAARVTKVRDFLDDVNKSYDSRDRNELAGVNVRKYYDTELLVLDDLGVSKITDKEKGVLHTLINERYKADRLCIITSNYVLGELPLLAATVDRINDMCMVLHFPEEPIRSRKALERQNRLLQYIDSYDKFSDSGETPFESGGTGK
ncbi:MAG: ATP-binding protein [Lachnospiraceae bacterium]|nr:ATP-binding protein [Lachnospiraceae bacterium]MDE7205152.1 ATP-binding protein [Lachnospiraceae bacterium]